MSTSDRGRGRLEIFAAGVLWSLGGVFIKSIAAPAPAIAAARSVFAALVFLPFVRRRPARSSAVVLASALAYTGVVGLFVYSTKITTAANAIILQYTAPAFVFLLELLLRGKRPSRPDLLTLLGGMAGISVIYLGSDPGDFLGITLSVASGFLFASWMVLTGAARDIDPVAMTCANNAAAAAILLPLAWQAGVMPSGVQLAALAIMGTVQLGLPYVLFSRGIRLVSASEASLITLIEPVLNPVWVALVVGEVPGRATLLGGAIILVTLAVRYGARLGKTAP